jgi:hypothetical protein
VRTSLRLFRPTLDHASGARALIARLLAVLVALVVLAWCSGFVAGLVVRGFYYWRGW